MSNVKEIQQIKTLIAEGKKKGYLTFDEVNKSLPADVNKPEQIEEIIGIFDQLNIAIVDSDKDIKSLGLMSQEGDEETSDVDDLQLKETEDNADYASRSTDPVRMYLREMGAVPLLDREGEVYIAKKIESREMDVLYALVEVPIAIEELVHVGEDLKAGRIKLKDVVKTIEEDDPSEDEMNQPPAGHLPARRAQADLPQEAQGCSPSWTSAPPWSAASSASRRRSWASRRTWSGVCATSSSKRPLSTRSSRPWAITCARCTIASATCRPTSCPRASPSPKSRTCSISSILGT